MEIPAAPMPAQGDYPETLQAADLISRQQEDAVDRSFTALRIECGELGRFFMPPDDLLRSLPDLRLLELVASGPADADKQTSLTYLVCTQDVDHEGGEPPLHFRAARVGPRHRGVALSEQLHVPDLQFFCISTGIAFTDMLEATTRSRLACSEGSRESHFHAQARVPAGASPQVRAFFSCHAGMQGAAASARPPPTMSQECDEPRVPGACHRAWTQAASQQTARRLCACCCRRGRWGRPRTRTRRT
jgi:hypothetical protein